VKRVPRTVVLERDPNFEAYIAARAAREAALAAVKQARSSRSPYAALTKQLSAAERQEFQALAALLAKPRGLS
jgi:hypothetical protein